MDGQVGGALASGRLEFRREPVVDRRSRRLGVPQYVFSVHLRQLGTFRPPQHLADALLHGLRGALTDLLVHKTIDDRDSVDMS